MKLSLQDIFKKKPYKGPPVAPNRIILDNELGRLHEHAKQLHREKMQLLQVASWALGALSEYAKRSPQYEKAMKILEELDE